MYDTSWDGVLLPGSVRREWSGGLLVDVLAACDGASYDRDLTRALAMLSWASYARFEWKMELYEAMGVEERFFADVTGTQCSLLTPTGDGDVSVVVFRGTAGLMQWIYNVGVLPRSWEGGGKVHSGFATAWKSVWGLLAPRLERSGQRLFTGHSLGGALATLSVGMLERSSGYVFGAPMVGNEAYSAGFPEERPLWRCVLGADAVSRLPLAVKEVERFRYSHVGLEVPLQSGVVSRREGALSLTELKEGFDAGTPPPLLSDHALGNYLWALK